MKKSCVMDAKHVEMDEGGPTRQDARAGLARYVTLLGKMECLQGYCTNYSL